ncbi:condensation domain-containing protein [Pannus brasiliensis]
MVNQLETPPQKVDPVAGESLGQTGAAQKELWKALQTIMTWQKQAPPLIPVSRQNALPLSYPQERLWFLQQLQPSKAAAYNIPLGFRLIGKLDRPALERSLTEILRRHEALRTAFALVEGKPVQVIHPPLPFNLVSLDWRALPHTPTPLKGGEDAEGWRETEAIELMRQEIQQPFDLTEVPPWRGLLIQLEEEKHLLLLTVHHIAIDAWSKGVLFQELAALYEAFCQRNPSPLAELPVQYADFAVWQRQLLQGEFQQVLLNYWQGQLDKNLEPLKLPEQVTTAPTRGRAASRKLVLPGELVRAIKSFSRREGATLFPTLLAAFKVLLHGYCQQDDIFVCSPIANRNRQEIKGLIGYFVNLLILRTSIDGTASFRELLAQVRRGASGAFAHQDLPIQQLLNSRQLLATPLSQVMFALQNTAIHTLQLSGLTVTRLELDSETVDFDLYLYLIEEGESLAAVLKYDGDLFSEETIARMLEQYQLILENVVANPEQSVSSLLPLSEAEKERLRSRQPSREPVIKNTPSSSSIAPRNAIELKLAQLWCQILGIESVGIRDNFFELGGQSLLAMSLFVQIEQAFGKTLPLSTLLEAPTIERLARTISSETVPSWSSLVPLQTSGSQPPFFCIHGQQGNVLNLRELARHFTGDRPFYGLQARGLDGKQAPRSVIEEMATHYLSEIRTIQARGPYFLGGNSMGGTIAFAMAQQLRQQGEEVAVLVLFDSFHKTAFPRLSFRQQHYLTYLSRLGFSPALLAELQELGRRELQEILCHFYSRLGRTLPHHLCRALVMEANRRAKWAYNPQVYPDRVVLLRAKEPANFTKPYLPTAEDWYIRDSRHGWGDLAVGGLEIYDVPGNHYSIFDSPNVSTLAATLKACLSQ